MEHSATITNNNTVTNQQQLDDSVPTTDVYHRDAYLNIYTLHSTRVCIRRSLISPSDLILGSNPIQSYLITPLG